MQWRNRRAPASRVTCKLRTKEGRILLGGQGKTSSPERVNGLGRDPEVLAQVGKHMIHDKPVSGNIQSSGCTRTGSAQLGVPLSSFAARKA